MNAFQLINPKKLLSFRSDQLQTTLQRLEDTINRNVDVKVLPGLQRITPEQAASIKNGQDGESVFVKERSF